MQNFEPLIRYSVIWIRHFKSVRPSARILAHKAYPQPIRANKPHHRSVQHDWDLIPTGPIP